MAIVPEVPVLNLAKEKVTAGRDRTAMPCVAELEEEIVEMVSQELASAHEDNIHLIFSFAVYSRRHRTLPERVDVSENVPDVTQNCGHA